MHDFTDLTGFHVIKSIIYNARFDIESRLAGRARLTELVLRLEHGCERSDLGLTVEIPQLYRRQSPLQLAQDLDRHDRCAVVTLLERRQIGRIQRLRTQKRDPYRRRGEERRDPVGGDERQYDVGSRLRGDDIGRSEIDAGSEKD